MFNTNYLILKMLSLPAVLIALVLHEYAHGYTAWKLGDPTAKRMGRLTLNPMAHLDPVGAVLMVLVGFGWAKPVPVDPRNFKNPRKGMALTALMGPVTNLLIAFVSAFLYLLTRKLCLLAETAAVLPVVIINFLYYLSLFFYVLHTLNLSLCVFNLIPLPPLDGSRILGMFLPARWYYWLLERERKIGLIFFVWLLLGDSVSAYLLTLPAVAASPVLTVLIDILSFSGWMNKAVGGLSGLFTGLFELIPFLQL